MYEEYLMHHGVKGMKWGVRRHLNYKLGTDRGRFGRRGAQRIQKYKAQGMTRAQAVQKVSRQKLIKTAAIGGLIGAGVIAYKTGYAQKGAQAVSRIIAQYGPGVKMDSLGPYYQTGAAVVHDILKRH